MKSSMVKIAVICVAMTVMACVAPAAWIGVPIVLGTACCACVALER